MVAVPASAGQRENTSGNTIVLEFNGCEGGDTSINCLKVLRRSPEDLVSFHDLQYGLAEERIDGLRRQGDHERLVNEARRRRSRRRRAGLWRRLVAPRLAATIQGANDILGAIVSPPWPAADKRTPPPIRANPGR
jgi:hypothetical protein